MGQISDPSLWVSVFISKMRGKLILVFQLFFFCTRSSVLSTSCHCGPNVLKGLVYPRKRHLLQTAYEFWPAWKLTRVTTPHWSNPFEKQKHSVSSCNLSANMSPFPPLLTSQPVEVGGHINQVSLGYSVVINTRQNFNGLTHTSLSACKMSHEFGSSVGSDTSIRFLSFQWHLWQEKRLLKGFSWPLLCSHFIGWIQTHGLI